ncbi:MAG: GC-type dockerin domain-anchored protein [Planctomycetota bacterium]
MNKLAITSMLAMSGLAAAQSLELEYTVTDIGGGQFEYEFFLTPDDGWAAGMAWRWFIFGDEPRDAAGEPGETPLTDFVGDLSSLPIGPWTGYGTTGGSHNGPNLAPVLDYWTPASADETLTWKGTSTADLGQGEMLFSTIAGTLGGAVAADFAVATRIEDACLPDVDGDGELTIFDFLEFQNLFDAGDLAADFDGDGELTIFDFLEFQNLFDVGCG